MLGLSNHWAVILLYYLSTSFIKPIWMYLYLGELYIKYIIWPKKLLINYLYHLKLLVKLSLYFWLNTCMSILRYFFTWNFGAWEDHLNNFQIIASIICWNWNFFRNGLFQGKYGLCMVFTMVGYSSVCEVLAWMFF